MTSIYEITVRDPEYRKEDFADETAAKAAVEKAGGGSVTSFAVEDNLPGLWPLTTHKSYASETFEDGVWRTNNVCY